jgi:monofunctional biosynthetic peptidoglycan transglycosylase
MIKRFAPTLIILAAVACAVVASQQLPQWALNLRHSLVPDVSVLQTHYPVAKGKEGRKNLYKLVAEKPKHWRRLNQISPMAVTAVLMSEDSSFYRHKGYDPEAIHAALEENLKAGRYLKGGSTITQQVAKNIFFGPEKTIKRKILELLTARELERLLGKRKILELYLNLAEWGPGIYGIEQAAQRYFAKSSAELNAREAATLAFMLPNPTRLRYSAFGENGPTHYGQARIARIVERLWRTGKISFDEYASSVDMQDLPSSL